MQRTKIEWTDFSLNPMKGRCLMDCWYCYTKSFFKRFGWSEEVRFDETELQKVYRLKKPAKIFVCSCFEIFHPIVLPKWRDAIFKVIEENPKHIFQVLTKLPQNIDRPMPNNVWLGITITGWHDWEQLKELKHKKAKIKFISCEPLLHPIPQATDILEGIEDIDWIIIGRITGCGLGHKYDPKREWVEEIIEQAKKNNIPIFIKDNMDKLLQLWGFPKIQQFPRRK